MQQRDLDTLTALNLDFFASVQKGDVKRFEEILADDFMSSYPDGSLHDKAEFLKLTAQPVTFSELEDERLHFPLTRGSHTILVDTRTFESKRPAAVRARFRGRQGRPEIAARIPPIRFLHHRRENNGD